MRAGVSYRIGRGSYLHFGGGGAVGLMLSFALFGGVLRIILATIFAALLLLAIFGAIYMNQVRTKQLLASAVEPSSVEPDGSYTNPKTWGVYQVEQFRAGKRGHGFHMGNHPVRHQELVREFGEAKLVALFEARVDAEELKYLLNSGRGHL